MGSSLISTARGTVINVHEFGATARLEDGSLAAIAADEFVAHRATYVSSRNARSAIDLRVVRYGRHATASLAREAQDDVGRILAEAPSAAEPDTLPLEPERVMRTDIAFEMRIGAYLRETEAWAPPDKPAPAERHFIRKKHRADVFEARKKTT